MTEKHKIMGRDDTTVQTRELGKFVLAVGLVSLFMSAQKILPFDARVKGLAPATATILNKRVESIHPWGETAYRGRILFSYVVDGKTYYMDAGTQQDATGYIDDAFADIENYTVGETLPVYYKLNNPETVYLHQQRAFAPYINVILSFWTIGAAFLLFAYRSERAITVRSHLGKFRLTRPQALTKSVPALLLATFLYTLGWLVPMAHYASTAVFPYSPNAVVAFGFCLMPTLLILDLLFFQWIRNMKFGTSDVEIDHQFFTAGTDCRGWIMQKFGRNVSVKEIQIGLVGTHRVQDEQGQASFERFQDWRSVPVGRNVPQSEILTVEHTFKVPLDAQLSYQRDDWQIVVRTLLKNGESCVRKFPVMVNGAVNCGRVNLNNASLLGDHLGTVKPENLVMSIKARTTAERWLKPKTEEKAKLEVAGDDKM